VNSPERVRAVVGHWVEGEGGAPPGWDAGLAGFLDVLERRNRDVNLVSRRVVSEALVGQVLPSLAVLRVVPWGRPLRVLDVGSGGGFPGIPLRILRPNVRLDLVDATHKKCAFLEDCLAELRLEGCAVHWCRIEEPSEELVRRGPFDRIFARALGDPDLVRRAAARLLAVGGEAWIFARPGGTGLEWPPPPARPVTALVRVV
jgi:16S rRNA (guanine527-N7)-methyltransferase